MVVRNQSQILGSDLTPFDCVSDSQKEDLSKEQECKNPYEVLLKKRNKSRDLAHKQRNTHGSQLFNIRKFLNPTRPLSGFGKTVYKPAKTMFNTSK